MQDNEFDPDLTNATERAERPNKEQFKREIQTIKTLVTQLIALPLGQLNRILMDGHARDQILAARKMERSALKRQIKYIVGVLREGDIAALERALLKLSQPHKQAMAEFHQLEQWRDKLLSATNDEVNPLINELVDQLGADRQQLRQLVRNARREGEANKPPKYARQLFQYLKTLQTSG